MKVAITGAGEFIADRLVEAFQLGEGPPFAVLGRTPRHLLRSARFAVDLRVADPLVLDSLARGFAGCSVVVHLAAAPATDGKRAASILCRAAGQAGVRRIIYLSSADVHGLCPPENTDEKSTLHTRHAWPACNALVQAERQFFNECRQLEIAGYALRAGLVYGPRNTLIPDLAGALQKGTASLVAGGSGWFNGLYVDNLIAAIRLALKTKVAAGSAFLLGDAEAITWRDFFQITAQELNLSPSAIHELPAPPAVAEAETVPPLTSAIPRTGGTAGAQFPTTPELLLRQQCTWALPVGRAARELAYRPAVSFTEGIRRTCAWWRFAGGNIPAAA